MRIECSNTFCIEIWMKVFRIRLDYCLFKKFTGRNETEQKLRHKKKLSHRKLMKRALQNKQETLIIRPSLMFRMFYMFRINEDLTVKKLNQ